MSTYADLTTAELWEHIQENDQDQETALLEYLCREDHDMAKLQSLRFQPKDWKAFAKQARELNVPVRTVATIVGKKEKTVEDVLYPRKPRVTPTNRTPQPSTPKDSSKKTNGTIDTGANYPVTSPRTGHPLPAATAPLRKAKQHLNDLLAACRQHSYDEDMTSAISETLDEFVSTIQLIKAALGVAVEVDWDEEARKLA